MISAQFHVDVVGELEHFLPSCKLLVPSAVLKEIAASIALKIGTSPPFKVLDMELEGDETVDDSLLRLSEKSRILCTNDRDLRIKARKRNINVVYLRQRKYLDVDGHLKG
jgi:rRNA-processing protein FCF1